MGKRRNRKEDPTGINVIDGVDEVKVVEDNPLSKKVKVLYNDGFNENENVIKDSELINTQIVL